MKIQYLKGTHDSVEGDIKDIPDMMAGVLIVIGIAKVFEEPPQPLFSTVVPENARLNLNGTPVIDDFGNISTVSPAAKPASKSTNRKKKE